MYTRKTGANKGILVICLESPSEWVDAIVLATGEDSHRYQMSAWEPELSRLQDEGEVEIAARFTETKRPVHIERTY